MTENLIYRNWLICVSQMINLIEIEIKITNHISKTWQQILELDRAMEYDPPWNICSKAPKITLKGEMAKMSTVKCEICNREGESLFIVSHKERGRIRICKECLKREGKSLQAQKSCCCN